MAEEVTLLHSPILINFVYPFLLIFFILFAVLEKSKVFGERKTQINALISFVISFIFVTAVFPKQMASNLMLFLAIGLVVIFVVLVLWGFIMGGEGLNIFKEAPKGLKWTIGIFILIAVFFAVLWAAGINTSGFFDSLFNSTWSSKFWNNVIFIVLVVVALAVMLATGKKSS